MADPGRPRKPNAIKEAQGTLERSRVTEEPKWAEGSAKPPAWLTDPAALEEWDRLVPLLIEQGLFPTTAHSQVAGICQQWGIWRESEDAIAKCGRVITTESGYQQPSSWVAIGNKAWSEYMTGCGRFGLDPGSAGKVTARPKNAHDDEVAKQREARRANR